MLGDSDCQVVRLFHNMYTKTPNAKRNGLKFGSNLFRRKTRMTYVGELHPINLFITRIPSGYSSLNCVLIGQNTIIAISVLSGSFERFFFFSFYRTLTSVLPIKIVW